MLWLLIGFLLGLVVMYLIAGLIVYNIAKPVNEWLLDARKVGLATLLMWPRDVRVMAEAGVLTGEDMLPHKNVVAGHKGNDPVQRP